MGQFDQAARSAADLEASYLLARVTALAKLKLRFRRWFDPRTVPLPGGPERIADLVAIADDPERPDAGHFTQPIGRYSGPTSRDLVNIRPIGGSHRKSKPGLELRNENWAIWAMLATYCAKSSCDGNPC